MWKKLVDTFRQMGYGDKRRIEMARPREFDIGEGKSVRMYGCTAEEADKVRELFNQPLTGETTPLESRDLPYVALGNFKNEKGYYELVEIKYNPKSGEAVISNIKTLEKDRSYRNEAFKIAIVKNGLL